MIDIKDKKDCCGCHACISICPNNCISMRADEEGFLYPIVDTGVCIDCGLCEKVCPVINQCTPRKPIKVYAAKNRDEDIRLKSSSGGVFSIIAESIIEDGGVVFGAKFDKDWNVVHSWTDTIEGLAEFRGSKYVQSCIGDTYREAEAFLKQDRHVLFSGTPCQIAGLKKFLRKEYKNLLTVEVVCHGVPSPLVWRDYLDYKRAKRATGKNSVSSSLNELPVITGISFRDKTNGWKKYGFKIEYAAFEAAENTVSKSSNNDNYEITPFNEDLFMKGFLNNLYLRPSCYHCVARQGKSGADISIADFWGVQTIHPELDDDRGIGLIIINTLIGAYYFNGLKNKINSTLSYYKRVITYNPCIVKSVAVPKYRDEFWESYSKNHIDAILPIYNKMKPSVITRVKNVLKRIVKQVTTP